MNPMANYVDIGFFSHCKDLATRRYENCLVSGLGKSCKRIAMCDSGSVRKNAQSGRVTWYGSALTRKAMLLRCLLLKVWRKIIGGLKLSRCSE